MRSVTRFFYKVIIKRILFLFPADTVHSLFLSFGRWLGKGARRKRLIARLWKYEDTALYQSIFGLTFKNPVGLSAGFDYNADLVHILPGVGFGFHTIGTLTLEAYEGNSGKMLDRLPKSKSLLVNKGFKNEGIQAVLSHLTDEKRDIIRGVSIGITNKAYTSYQEMITNLTSGFREAEAFSSFDFYELNISCPNLHHTKSFANELATPTGLAQALIALAKLQLKRPILIKMPVERTESEMTELIDAAVPFAFVKGLIFSNLVKDRNNTAFDKKEIEKAGAGNFSGKPVSAGSNRLLRFAYKKYHNRFILVGVGGIFNAMDAYEKIKNGATLVQLITGMVYEGPQLIGEINEQLIMLLKKDGYNNISEAIGVEVPLT